MVQSLLHSATTLLVVESAIVVLDLRSHLERFRYRLLTMFLPVCMFPLFQILSPSRGSFYFRIDTAIFDSTRWLDLHIKSVPVVSWVLVALLTVSALITLVQEIVPFLRGVRGQRMEAVPALGGAPGCVQQLLTEMARVVGVATPDLRVLDEDQPVIYTVGARRPSIVISDGLLALLDREQLRSALAHELAHVRRQSNATTFLVYLARLVMFYNPVSLLLFRRIIQDDEHICDDITAGVTGDPAELAATLRVFATDMGGETGGIRDLGEAIGDHSHNLLLLERIERLEENDIAADTRFRPARFVVTAAAVLVLNYYVV